MAKAGEAFKFRIMLFDADGELVAVPTLAAGDVVVIGSDGAAANITTMPTLTGVASGVLDVTLSAAEMAGSAGDRVSAVFKDQVGEEWRPVAVDIELTSQDVDDLATQASVNVVDGNVDAVLVDTGTDIPAAIAALNDLSAAEVNAEVVDALATDVIADSIPADGSRPTIAQALYMLVQYMNERSVSTTTVTVKKPDGASTLYTLTLDDATNPTAVTRAT